MPRSNFFAHLGLLVVNDFLDAELCARLRAEMSTGSVSAATLERKAYGVVGHGVVDEDVRRAGVAEVSADSKLLIRARLTDLLPRLESHFNLALKMFEAPQFLTYNRADFSRRIEMARMTRSRPNISKSEKSPPSSS
jgi:hypothetical protein